MNISRARLQQIIIEEYLREEGILGEALSPERADEMIAWIRREGPKPEWLDRDYGPGSYQRKKGAQAPGNPNVDRSADTMPFPTDDMPQYDDEDVDDGGAYDPDAEAEVSDIPSDDAPERDVSGFQDRAGPPLEDQLMDLIQGLPPEEVADLFQAVFEKIPGVELGEPEEEPESLYSPGAEGRPAISLGPIREHLAAKSFEKILEIAGLSYGTHSIAGVPGARDEDEEVDEGHYHDMGGEGEMYDALDPHGFDSMSDAELIDAMHTDGMEEMIVLDGEGDLANREEVIAALKDV